MDHTQVIQLLNSVYHGIDGLTISQSARNTLSSYSLAHSYGEAPLENFFAAMDLIVKPTDAVFYDLGSGLGKKVLATALTYPIKHCGGIEVLKPLVDESEKAVLKARDLIPELQSKTITFINADYYSIDISMADIVFVSVMPQILEAQLQGTLLSKFNTLKFGSRVITSAIPIRSSQFEYITTIPDPIAKGAIGELHVWMKK